MNLIEQLEQFSSKAIIPPKAKRELLLIIEQAKREAVEPVAVLALKNTELSNRVGVLEDLLSSAYAIANRNGENTHWGRFVGQLHVNGINPVTAKTFKILTSDPEYASPQPDHTKLIGELVEALEELSGNPLWGGSIESYHNWVNNIALKAIAKAREAIK